MRASKHVLYFKGMYWFCTLLKVLVSYCILPMYLALMRPFFFINPDDPYLICKFSAESAYIVCCPNKKQSPKTTINAIIAIFYNRKKSCSVGVEILFKPYMCAYIFQA